MLKSFIYNEEGVETMEWLAILAGVAVLIPVLITIGNKVKAKLSTAATYL